MKPRSNSFDALSRQVNEKSRELQGIQEAIDAGNQNIASLQKHSQNLRKENEGLDNAIKERNEALKKMVEHEQKALSEIQAKRIKEASDLESVKKELEIIQQELSATSPIVEEARRFISKADQYRTEYLDLKQKCEAAIQDCKQALQDKDVFLIETAIRQKEMDALKQNLSDLYGKVASYMRVASETIGHVNQELEKTGTPARFSAPDGNILQITLENFTEIGLLPSKQTVGIGVSKLSPSPSGLRLTPHTKK